MKMKRHFSPLFIFCMVSIGIVLFGITFVMAGILSRHAVERELRFQLNDTSRLIKKHYLTKNQSALVQLANLYSIRSICEGELPHGDAGVTKILEGMLYGMDAISLNVVNGKGIIIASTYGENEKTLVGYKSLFRPYFIDAMNGKKNLYADIGLTTGKKELYMSCPVKNRKKEKIVGVVVAKLTLTSIDGILNEQASPTALVSPEGIIFSCNRQDYLFHQAITIPEPRLQNILYSHQFTDKSLRPLPFTLEKNDTTYLDRGRIVLWGEPQLSGWRLVCWELPEYPLTKAVLAASGVFIFYIILIGLFTNYRMKNVAEKMVKVSSADYVMIFNSSSDAIFVFDPDTRIIIDINVRVIDIFHYIKEDILGMNIEDLFSGEHPFTIGEFLKRVQKAIAQGPQVFEWYCRDRNGCSFWAEIILKMTQLQGVDRMLVFLRDITKQREARESLKTSKEQVQTIINSITAGVVIIDPKTHLIEYANPAVLEMSGFSKNEVEGKLCHNLLCPSEKGRCPITDLDQNVDNSERILMRKEGGSIDVLKTVRQIKISGVPKLIESFVDIRTLKQAQDGLKRALSDLERQTHQLEKSERVALRMMEDSNIARKETEQAKIEIENINAQLKNQVKRAEYLAKKAETATQVKSDFITNMSHEIRTPMNTILGFLELVLEDPSLSELQRKHLTIARISASGLLELLNDILDISKMERGKLTIEQRPFSLNRLMKEIYGIMELKAREKGLELQFDIESSLSGSFIGDPLKLRQIIVNLVGNALKYTEKGRVSMRIMPAEKEDQLYFMVEDTGIGMTEDQLSQIFEPFTQGDSSTTRQFGGAGLGMTIARDFVKLIGGRIWVESEEGKGSTFHFTISLPHTDQAPEETDLFIVPGRSVLSGSRRAFRVLLVEDVEADLYLAKIRIESQGHEVMVALSGREAIDVFLQEKIDIVLMDIQMPEMDGLEATTLIRALGANAGRHVPIIAMTASVMREERKKYLELGIDAVVAKPINFYKLFKTMEKVVPEGVGWKVAKFREDATSPPGMGLRSLNGIDIKKAIQTWQDTEAYTQALLEFSHDYRNAAADLTRLIDNGDTDRAYRVVHTLKGVVGNLSITEVFDAIINIDAALREKRIDDVKAQLSTFSAALNTAVDSIGQLEAVQDTEEVPKKEIDVPYLTALFIKMLATFDQFNPYIIEPFLFELQEYLSYDQLNPIVKHIEAFNFDGAKKETAKLAEALKIDIEEQYARQ